VLHADELRGSSTSMRMQKCALLPYALDMPWRVEHATPCSLAILRSGGFKKLDLKFHNIIAMEGLGF
jgi:hypothetical protein